MAAHHPLGDSSGGRDGSSGKCGEHLSDGDIIENTSGGVWVDVVVAFSSLWLAENAFIEEVIRNAFLYD